MECKLVMSYLLGVVYTVIGLLNPFAPVHRCDVPNVANGYHPGDLQYLY